MSRWTMPVVVGHGQRVGDDPGDRHGLVRRQRPSAMRSLSGRPDTKSMTSDGAVRVVDQAARPDDRRVVDGAERLGLALEPCPSDRVGHDMRMEPLDRDDLACPLVAGAPDRGHPARRVPVQKRVAVRRSVSGPSDECITTDGAGVRPPLLGALQAPSQSPADDGPTRPCVSIGTCRDDRPLAHPPSSPTAITRRPPWTASSRTCASPARPRSRRASARPAPAR